MAESKWADLPKFSKSQLASLFGLHRQTVSSRLAKVAPCGKDSRGHDVWSIPKASLYLVEHSDRFVPEQDEEGYIDPDRLPPDMFKDYWDGQLKKQKYLKEEGDLWHTQQVVEAIALVVKPIANFMRSMPDWAEHSLGLTPKQVKLVADESRQRQEEMYKAVVEVAGGGLQQPE